MRDRWFLDDKGPDPSAAPVLSRLLQGRYGVIQSINQVEQPPGTPPSLTQVTAEIANTVPISSNGNWRELGAGTAESSSVAREQAIGEAIERYCLSVYDENKLSHGYAEESDERVAPDIFNKSNKSIFNAAYYWANATEYRSNNNVKIPAHLVYFPFQASEQFIRNPTTTGAATHMSYHAATRAAIQEVVERDAYIISYLNKLENPHIGADLVDKANATSTVEEFREYGFEPTLVYLTLDVPVHVVLSVLVDQCNGNISCGLSANFEFDAAIHDALFESYHTYSFARDLDQPDEPPRDNITSLEDRAKYWLAKSDTIGMNHWLGDGHTTLNELPSAVGSTRSLLEWFSENDMNVYVADVSTTDTLQRHFKTVRTVIPKLHPMHLVEPWMYTGGERLYNAPIRAGLRKTQRSPSELNDVPHPFL